MAWESGNSVAWESLCPSMKKTSRCVIVEEGWPFAGAGAEISHRIMTGAFDYLDAPVTRVTGEDVPMPYAKNLEHLVFPGTEKVINAVNGVLYRS
jgi:pyruvate dehydrogenase E1 component beta subunit